MHNLQLRKEGFPTNCRNIVVQGSLRKGSFGMEYYGHHFAERSLRKVNCRKIIYENKKVERSLQKGNCRRISIAERKFQKVVNNEFNRVKMINKVYQ